MKGECDLLMNVRMFVFLTFGHALREIGNEQLKKKWARSVSILFANYEGSY